MNKSNLALAVSLVALATEATAAGFIEDSKASIGLRNFYYDLNTRNTDNNNGEAREWGDLAQQPWTQFQALIRAS